MEFCLPKLDHTMEEAYISEWLKAPGDTVNKGDILLTVETGKAIMEVESFVSGELLEILAAPGETVAVHAPIAVIRER